MDTQTRTPPGSRYRGAFLLCTACLLLATACGSGQRPTAAAPAGLATPADAATLQTRLEAALLQVDDLPTGFAPAPVGAAASETPPTVVTSSSAVFQQPASDTDQEPLALSVGISALTDVPAATQGLTEARSTFTAVFGGRAETAGLPQVGQARFSLRETGSDALSGAPQLLVWQRGFLLVVVQLSGTGAADQWSLLTSAAQKQDARLQAAGF